MSDPKFITIPDILYGNKIVNVDNIASVEMYMSGSKVILKQVTNGTNDTIVTTATVAEINTVIYQVLHS